MKILFAGVFCAIIFLNCSSIVSDNDVFINDLKVIENYIQSIKSEKERDHLPCLFQNRDDIVSVTLSFYPNDTTQIEKYYMYCENNKEAEIYFRGCSKCLSNEIYLSDSISLLGKKFRLTEMGFYSSCETDTSCLRFNGSYCNSLFDEYTLERFDYKNEISLVYLRILYLRNNTVRTRASN